MDLNRVVWEKVKLWHVLVSFTPICAWYIWFAFSLISGNTYQFEVLAELTLLLLSPFAIAFWDLAGKKAKVPEEVKDFFMLVTLAVYPILVILSGVFTFQARADIMYPVILTGYLVFVFSSLIVLVAYLIWRGTHQAS